MHATLQLSLCVAVAAADSVLITLTNQVRSPIPIRDSFVGISAEVDGAVPLLSFNGQPRRSYINLMKTLAGSATKGVNIRIGGGSVDTSAYVPVGPLPANITYRITDVDLNTYAAAVSSWGGDAVMAVTLRNESDPSLAVAHARAMSGIMGWDLVTAVEIGNEPNLFPQGGIRPSPYTYSEYAADYNLYASALATETNLTSRHIQGATFCCRGFDANITEYIDTFGSGLTSFSYHYYPLNHCGGNMNQVWQLLVTTAAYSVAEQYAGYVAYSLSKGIPFVIGEGNSIACGGQYGISDVFASALWAVDTMFAVASVGVSRWNFHGGTLGAYSPIWYNSSATPEDIPDVRPLFYGMWAFANATARNPYVYNATVETRNQYIKAWYIVDENGDGTVIVIHKYPDVALPANVSIVPFTPLSQAATLTRLQPSMYGVNATHGISFAGYTFDGSQDGLPLGTYVSESVPSVGGAFNFTMQPASIAFVALPRV